MISSVQLCLSLAHNFSHIVLEITFSLFHTNFNLRVVCFR